MEFKKAIKYQAKLRMALAGPSGSGKTYTALTIAKEMGGRVALVDTEHGSASKYADLFDFDVLELEPPFHPDYFGRAIVEAQKEGYDIVILDSLSHAWMGAGGLLELVDKFAEADKTGGKFGAWRKGTPIQNRLVETITRANIHVIACMRSKTDYLVDEDSAGKMRVRKVGMAPIQRDSFEYEFDVFAEMNMDNNMIISKTRCPDLVGQVIEKPKKEPAAILMRWLGGQERPEQSVKEFALSPIAPESHGGWWKTVLGMVELSEEQALSILERANYDQAGMDFENRMVIKVTLQNEMEDESIPF